jgi:hypothetical protein
MGKAFGEVNEDNPEDLVSLGRRHCSDQYR